MRNCFLSLVTLTLAFCIASAVTAGGLSTNLGEVVITGLGRGEKYSLKKLANIPLSVVNRGEDTVMVRICALVPDSVELRQGAEPIPSTDWVSLEADSLLLAPEQMGISDVFIEIPSDTSLAGRKFQVMVWSRTIPGPGVMIACGLKSRIIFSIASAGSPDKAGGGDAGGIDKAGGAAGTGVIGKGGGADAESGDKAGESKNKKADAKRTNKTRANAEH